MKRLVMVLFACVACVSAAAELPEVTTEALSELGTTLGTPQMSGFVFIEGRYFAPPYTVTRRGNGIFINRIQIEQPVSWARFAAAPVPEAEPAAVPAKKKLDADGDFEEVKPAAPAVVPADGMAPAVAEPAAMADPAVVAEPAAAAEPAAVAEPAAGDPAAAVDAPAKPKTVKSIDDLFDDDAAAMPAAAPDAAAPVNVPAAVPAALPEAVAVPAVAPVLQPVEMTSEELKRQKELLVANLERLRKGYELALARNEFFFFGLRHNRVNGNYGTARTLMGVLPKALRYAQSPQDLLHRLNQGGVYFLDLGICSALFRNRGTFPLLEERLTKILEAEEYEALRRKSSSNW